MKRVKTAVDEESQSDYRIVFEIEGATQEDLERGLVAAYAVFDKAGLAPWDGAGPFHDLTWGLSQLSTEQENMGYVYGEAIDAALQEACKELPDTAKKYEFSIYWNDEPPYEPSPFAIEVCFPETYYGKPIEQLTTHNTGKRRVLNGWKWEWLDLNRPRLVTS